MKSYKEISEDIRSTVSKDLSGMQLDTLVGILSMYVYEVQSNAVSQLLEGNLDTAININSIISKASQLGVSCPRVKNPEVELEVKSANARYELNPGSEVLSIGKFKFIYLGYILEGELVPKVTVLDPTNPTLIRCLITDDVTILNIKQIPGDIYDTSISNVASKIFVYKNGTLLNVYSSYSDYLSDSGLEKMYSVTKPDYGVKLTDELSGDISEYKIILPRGLSDVSKLIPLLKNKVSTRNLMAPSLRSDETQNMKLVNLGSETLSKSDLVTFVETNLKLTQFIKSNSDIVSYFTEYLFNLYGVRYNVNFKLSKDLIIYVSDKYFNSLDVSELVPKFYVGLESISIEPGVELKAEVNIRLNNQIDDPTSNKIEGFVAEWNNIFKSTIDEYELISKINSINPLIQLTEFSVLYSTNVEVNGVSYPIKLSKDVYDIDVADLQFDKAPDINKTYKLYLNKSMFIKTYVVWL